MAASLIELEDVALRYRLARHRIRSFKEYAIHLVRGALTYQDLWALREVTFAIGEGETVGVVGRNGAGKTTLLKVVSRILKPTAGRVRIRGRVAPILALGTGFDYELTGYENIFLNALLLGRTRREVENALRAIVEFSELGEHLEAPLRNYSSGMTARLGFAIATAWRCEILLLDEVLAVGDAAFAVRCRDRIAEFRAAGSTILLVSHSDEAILANCERCLWLEAGRLRADGPAPAVIEDYRHSMTPSEAASGQL
jgi:ABC-type polysaccharide/polyol phosphate transport system ATPase subunit